MDIPLDDIFFKADERLRRSYGRDEMVKLADSLASRGQFQDILVREPAAGEEIEGAKWALVDGGRRFLAAKMVYARDGHIPDVKLGCISAKVHGVSVTRHQALEIEFLANEQRKDFTWKERGLLIRRLHETYTKLYKEQEWDVAATADLLDMSKEMVYKYLSLTEERYFSHPQIAAAETFVAAYKQYQIIKDRARREAESAAMQKLVKKLEDTGQLEGRIHGPLVDEKAVAQKVYDSVWPGDVRKWLARQQDDSFDWFHWDPPYGGSQAGGATTYLEKIDDSESYSLRLMEEALPEIWRTMRDGAWLAIWYYLPYYHRIQGLLQGHKYNSEGVCEYCGKYWTEQHTRCWCYAKAPWRFWVNPYPYVWYKRDRVSSDHEIKRFSISAYESFMLACKAVDVEPILPNTATQNVISYPMVRGKSRDHIMQKPKEVLAWVLSLISVKGSRGGDGGTGSGSIFEAAFGTGRDCVGVELSENYFTISQKAAERGLKHWDQLDLSSLQKKGTPTP